MNSENITKTFFAPTTTTAEASAATESTQSTKPPILRIKDLEAGYDDSLILHGVNLEVYAGEQVALIGPNGAGKSTILRAIFSIAKQRSGSIEVDGDNIHAHSIRELVEHGVIYVNQGNTVFPKLTVSENLYMPGALLLKGEALAARVERTLTFFPVLREKLNSRAITLSGGQRQQLALGRALVQGPKLLLLDEPSLGLSPILQKEFFAKIDELRATGVAILMVEQNARMAIEHADRTYLLENGKIVLSGGSEILKHPIIKKVYLGG